MLVKTFAAKPDNFEFDSQDPHGGKKDCCQFCVWASASVQWRVLLTQPHTVVIIKK